MQLHIGTTLQGGKYRITELLGQGGFGITYLAEQPLMLNRKVAIKEFFLKEYFTRNVITGQVTCPTGKMRETAETYRRKFIKEAQLQLKMRHPNLVEVYDVFTENATVYYVMEYVDGEPLADIVKRRGALTEEEAVGYIKKVAEALRYIHAHHVTHLDVKPANILIRKSDGCVKLIDFGTSKHYDSKSGEQTTIATPCYSPGYAPIEQYKVGGISIFSPQTDIYALGATLYKMLTGVTPPSAIDLQNEDARLSPLPDEISSGVRECVKRAMIPQRGKRTQSVSDFLSMLGKQKHKWSKVTFIFLITLFVVSGAFVIHKVDMFRSHNKVQEVTAVDSTSLNPSDNKTAIEEETSGFPSVQSLISLWDELEKTDFKQPNEEMLKATGMHILDYTEKRVADFDYQEFSYLTLGQDIALLSDYDDKGDEIETFVKEGKHPIALVIGADNNLAGYLYFTSKQDAERYFEQMKKYGIYDAENKTYCFVREKISPGNHIISSGDYFHNHSSLFYVDVGDGQPIKKDEYGDGIYVIELGCQ